LLRNHYQMVVSRSRRRLRRPGPVRNAEALRARDGSGALPKAHRGGGLLVGTRQLHPSDNRFEPLRPRRKPPPERPRASCNVLVRSSYCKAPRSGPSARIHTVRNPRRAELGRPHVRNQTSRRESARFALKIECARPRTPDMLTPHSRAHLRAYLQPRKGIRKDRA